MPRKNDIFHYYDRRRCNTIHDLNQQIHTKLVRDKHRYLQVSSAIEHSFNRAW